MLHCTCTTTARIMWTAVMDLYILLSYFGASYHVLLYHGRHDFDHFIINWWLFCFLLKALDIFKACQDLSSINLDLIYHNPKERDQNKEDGILALACYHSIIIHYKRVPHLTQHNYSPLNKSTQRRLHIGPVYSRK